MKEFIKKHKTIFIVIVCMLFSGIVGVSAAYIFSSDEVSYDNSKSKMSADNVQDAVDELYGHATDYIELNSIINALDIGGESSISTTNVTLYNSTGTIINNRLLYKIIGKHMILSGRLELKVDSRSGDNPGVNITIPKSKKLRAGFGVFSGPCTTLSASRHGEVTQLTGVKGNNYIRISTTETHTTVSAGQTLVFYISTTIIPIE